MVDEKKRLLYSLVIPFLFVFFLWVVKTFEVLAETDLAFLGVYPLKWQGMIGIITSPLIHADFAHLISNSIPLLILGGSLFYFYKDIAFRVMALIYVVTGIWTWVFAREAYHIGASGLVYGLASFLFISGLVRRNNSLMALALIIAFLYGSMVWGVFPEFFPEKNISWESHLMGIIAGAVLAVYYRKEGPQRKIYEWEEDEEDDDDTDNQYWNTTITRN